MLKRLRRLVVADGGGDSAVFADGHGLFNLSATPTTDTLRGRPSSSFKSFNNFNLRATLTMGALHGRPSSSSFFNNLIFCRQRLRASVGAVRLSGDLKSLNSSLTNAKCRTTEGLNDLSR
ncbi:MAG: hypothetical protein MPL62_01530 [Alphaproteobacteria bacterium]|nr:hypothetical protein [Alphaproteobacteria bacterium]